MGLTGLSHGIQDLSIRRDFYLGTEFAEIYETNRIFNQKVTGTCNVIGVITVI